MVLLTVSLCPADALADNRQLAAELQEDVKVFNQHQLSRASALHGAGMTEGGVSDAPMMHRAGVPEFEDTRTPSHAAPRRPRAPAAASALLPLASAQNASPRSAPRLKKTTGEQAAPSPMHDVEQARNPSHGKALLHNGRHRGRATAATTEI